MKTVRDIMNPVVICLEHSAFLPEAAQQLRERGISGAPVINADGDYVRYADGTQICTRTLTGIAVGSAYGSLFRSAVLTASYAAPFVARPTASGCCQSTSMCWANVRSSSPTQWGCALWSTEARSSETAELIAIGRWY